MGRKGKLSPNPIGKQKPTLESEVVGLRGKLTMKFPYQRSERGHFLSLWLKGELEEKLSNIHARSETRKKKEKCLVYR